MSGERRQEFSGKVAWVTGASAGLGRAMALEFARRGADVAVSARRADRLDEVSREIAALGARALAVPCDVTREESVHAAVSEVVARFGHLDIAVANAGFSVGGPFEKLSAGDWRRQFETNVIGLVTTARAALPWLRQSRGRLALVGSVSALIATPRTAPYCASKAAVRSIGQVLSMELHGSGVSCTSLHPGFVASEIAQVDNQGHFHAERRDSRPRQLMWPTERAARVMVTAISRRRREVVFTGHGRLAAWLGRHAPGLVHFAVTRGQGSR